MKKILFGSVFFSFLILATAAYAGTIERTYKIPDVRDAYCGSVIDFQYCKCAFHDKFCGNIGLSQSGAHGFVLAGFQEWNKEKIQTMGEACIARGDYWDRSAWSCVSCTEGDVLDGSKCKAQKNNKEDNKSEENQCKKDLEAFGANWEKYSDFDVAITTANASYEVQQYNRVLDELAEKISSAQVLEYEMEIDRQTRLLLREYKQALVQNIRNNITKTIFRLSWVTFNTVKSAFGTHGTYEKFLNPENAAQGLGATLKLIQAHIPPSRKDLQFDTSKAQGAIISAAWNAELEVLESVGDPVGIAVQVMKDARTAAVGSPDMTDADVAILRNQHLENKAIDVALAESYAENALRRKELLLLKKQIAEKYNELQEWKAKERARVYENIKESCNGNSQ